MIVVTPNFSGTKKAEPKKDTSKAEPKKSTKKSGK